MLLGGPDEGQTHGPLLSLLFVEKVALGNCDGTAVVVVFVRRVATVEKAAFGRRPGRENLGIKT